jgi:hypothetical protein
MQKDLELARWMEPVASGIWHCIYGMNVVSKESPVCSRSHRELGFRGDSAWVHGSLIGCARHRRVG